MRSPGIPECELPSQSTGKDAATRKGFSLRCGHKLEADHQARLLATEGARQCPDDALGAGLLVRAVQRTGARCSKPRALVQSWTENVHCVVSIWSFLKSKSMTVCMSATSWPAGIGSMP